MKRLSVILLVLLAAVITSCSISAGFPGLYGGWGFFFDFGTPRGDNLPDGNLLLEQDGASLTGTLTTGDKIYQVEGECFRNQTLLLKLTDENGEVTELNGIFENNTINAVETEESNWFAVREQ
ncbi:MAG TPA: hypothetical protein PK466_02265 [Thermotogota bacterium]|nr:hypothetical protein [Thermotogota bacterium]HPJ89060.1 hypothetical protein [Thermotogota bacterium]HPR95126.1 hypothetical protein [Thermotogota bacterium]